LPATRLSAAGLLQGRCLDYGCGRGFDADYFGIEGYDPYYRKQYPEGKFETILCIYVLNVLQDESERIGVLQSILSLLEPGGSAYITVRRDIKRPGVTSRGTYQGLIELALPILHKTSSYITYILRHGEDYGNFNISE